MFAATTLSSNNFNDLTKSQTNGLTDSANGDVFVGLAGADDVFTASEANLENADHILVDGSSSDNDVLNITGTAFSTNVTTLNDVVRGIENVNVSFDSLVQSTFVASGIGSASTITVSQVRDGGSGDIVISTVAGGSTVVAGAGVTDLTVNNMAAGAALTVDAGTATGVITAAVTGDDATASVVADSAGTIVISSTTASASASSNNAATIDVDTTSGDITVTSGADADIDADSTAAGNITVTAASSTDVTANTTGAGAVTIVAEGNSVTYTGAVATITLDNLDTTDASVTANGTGAEDTLTLNVGGDFGLNNATAVETITVNASAATVMTLTGDAAETYASTGSGALTFTGDEADFDGSTVTGADRLNLTTVGTAADLTGVDVATVIEFSGAAAAATYTLNDGATLDISADNAGATDLDIDDGDDDTDSEGSVNLVLSEDIGTGAVTLDQADDIITTVDLTVDADQTGLAFTGTSDTTLNIAGSSDLTFTAAAVTAGTIDASNFTGVLTMEADGNAEVVTSGSGQDVITVSSTNSTADVDAGSGNDTVVTAAALTGSVSGGNGTDTLDVNGSVDLSGATLSSFEIVDIAANNVALDDGFVDGQALVVNGTGTLEVNNIAASLDLSLLTFANAALSTEVDFVNDRDVSLGVAANLNVTGSSQVDTVTTGNGTNVVTAGAGDDVITGGTGVDQVFGEAGADTVSGGNGADLLNGGAGDDELNGQGGNDTLTGGEGSDAITGGDGNDTIDLTEVTSAADTLTYVTGADGTDTITGFESGSDQYVTDFASSASNTAGDASVVTAVADTVSALTIDEETDDVFQFTGVTAGADMTDEQTVIDAISDGTINLDGGSQDDLFFLSLVTDQGTYLYEVTEDGADDVLTVADTITLVATFSDSEILATGDIQV